MADSNEQFKIEIISTADNGGFTSTTKAVDGLNLSTKEGASAQDKLTQASKETEKTAGEMAEKFALNRTAMLQLNRLAPELGHLLKESFEGLPGLIAIATIGLALLKEKYDEQVKAEAEASDGHEFVEGLKAKTEALNRGAEAIETYVDHIERIATAEASVAQSLANQLGIESALATARAARVAAEEKAAKAKTEFQEKAGEITPEQAALTQAKADVKSIQDAAAAKLSDQQRAIDDKQAALDKARKDQPGLAADTKAKQAKAAAEEAQANRLERDYGSDDAKKARQAANTKADDIDEMVEQYRKQGAEDPEADSHYEYLDLLQKQEKARHEAELLNHGYQQFLRTNSPEAKKQRKADATAAEEADKKGTENATKARELADEIPVLIQKLKDAQTESAREVAAKVGESILQAMQKILAQPHGAELQTGINLADQVEKRHNLSNDQASFLIKLANSLGAHTANLKTAADYLEKFKDNTGAFLEAVTKLLVQHNAKLEAQGRQIAALTKTAGGG